MKIILYLQLKSSKSFIKSKYFNYFSSISSFQNFVNFRFVEHSALALAAILEKVSAIMAIRRFIRMTTVKMKNVNLQRNANSVSRNAARGTSVQ